jgi:hypothetical protein
VDVIEGPKHRHIVAHRGGDGSFRTAHEKRLNRHDAAQDVPSIDDVHMIHLPRQLSSRPQLCERIAERLSLTNLHPLTSHEVAHRHGGILNRLIEDASLGRLENRRRFGQQLGRQVGREIGKVFGMEPRDDIHCAIRGGFLQKERSHCV